jgi:hypothetical protein
VRVDVPPEQIEHLDEHEPQPPSEEFRA